MRCGDVEVNAKFRFGQELLPRVRGGGEARLIYGAAFGRMHMPIECTWAQTGPSALNQGPTQSTDEPRLWDHGKRK